jgi:transposase-like protein
VSCLVASKIGGRDRCIVVVQGTPVPAGDQWLYHRLPLSFREVEELMLQRGVVVSYETIRQWCAKFGQVYANPLRGCRARPGGKWHLDEVFIRINGTIHYLWRAVDRHGNVLDVLVQSRRNALAAKKFFRRLLKGPPEREGQAFHQNRRTTRGRIVHQ